MQSSTIITTTELDVEDEIDKDGKEFDGLFASVNSVVHLVHMLSKDSIRDKVAKHQCKSHLSGALMMLMRYDLMEESNALKNEKEILVRDIHHLTNELKEVRDNRDAIKDELNKVKKEIEYLQALSVNEIHERETILMMNANSITEPSDENKTVDVLKAELQASRALNIKYREAISKAKVFMDTAKETFKCNKDEIAKLNQEIQNRLDEIDQLNETVEEVQERNRKLKEINKLAKDAILAQIARNKQLSQEMDEMKSKYGLAMEYQHKEAAKYEEELKDEINNLKASLERAEASRLNNEVNKMNQQLQVEQESKIDNASAHDSIQSEKSTGFQSDGLESSSMRNIDEDVMQIIKSKLLDLFPSINKVQSTGTDIENYLDSTLNAAMSMQSPSYRPSFPQTSPNQQADSQDLSARNGLNEKDSIENQLLHIAISLETSIQDAFSTENRVFTKARKVCSLVIVKKPSLICNIGPVSKVFNETLLGSRDSRKRPPRSSNSSKTSYSSGTRSLNEPKTEERQWMAPKNLSISFMKSESPRKNSNALEMLAAVSAPRDGFNKGNVNIANLSPEIRRSSSGSSSSDLSSMMQSFR